MGMREKAPFFNYLAPLSLDLLSPLLCPLVNLIIQFITLFKTTQYTLAPSPLASALLYVKTVSFFVNQTPNTSNASNASYATKNSPSPHSNPITIRKKELSTPYS